MHLALNKTLTQTAKGWIVTSESSSSLYIVALDLSQCTCRDYEERQPPCKHIYAVMHMLEGIADLEPDPESTQARVTYAQDWTAYNLAQTNEKATF